MPTTPSAPRTGLVVVPQRQVHGLVDRRAHVHLLELKVRSAAECLLQLRLRQDGLARLVQKRRRGDRHVLAAGRQRCGSGGTRQPRVVQPAPVLWEGDAGGRAAGELRAQWLNTWE